MIVGPDGTGKTTLCTALVQRLASSVPVRELANRRGAEPLSLLPGRAPRGNTAVPHRHQPRSMPLSIAKLFYSYVDMTLAWSAKVRPFVRRGGWVVIERGGWDMVVDPLRYRLRVPQWLGRICARIMPRPSIVLVLEASPEVITARKAQLPPAELVRQMHAWREILPASQQRMYLDTSAPVEALLRAISEAASLPDESNAAAGASDAVTSHEVEQPHA